MNRTKARTDVERQQEEQRMSGQFRKVISAILLLGLGLIVVQAQTVRDIDGNVYNTVKIGTQVWMKENLKTTKYRNGDLIGTTNPATLYISFGEDAPRYQWAYDGNESYVDTYGRLYTWYAVTDSRNICPLGWHIPTNSEWIILSTYLGGDSIAIKDPGTGPIKGTLEHYIVAGGKLKEVGTTHWQSPNTGATNESGFSALPGGFRDFRDLFKWLGYNGSWWSSTSIDPAVPGQVFAFNRSMTCASSNLFMNMEEKAQGYSVRCLLSMAQAREEYYNSGEAKFDIQDYIGAILEFNKVIDIDTEDAAVYYSRGEAKYNLQDYKGAIADFTEALELDPTAMAYCNRGVAKKDLQDQMGAIEDYTMAIALDPKLALAYYNRGLAKQDLEDFRGAIADYTKAIELDPTDRESYFNRGWVKSRLQDHIGAIADYTKAIEINPEHTDVFFNRGLDKFNLQDYRGAIADYTKAIELDPEYADAYCSRGLAKRGLKDRIGAISDFTKAIALDPKYAGAYCNRGLTKIELAQKDSGCLDLSKAGELGYEKAYELIKKYCL
jgi:uncharacterized protein (TIGR02145 family)